MGSPKKHDWIINGFLWGSISPIKVELWAPGPDNWFVGPPCRDLTMTDLNITAPVSMNGWDLKIDPCK